MLKMQRVERYTIPKYPCGVYSESPNFISFDTPRAALTAAIMAFLLEACDGTGGGIVGIPVPDLRALTEAEARPMIDQVFAENGIELTHDVDIKVETSPGDTATINVDGYNDSLGVGYEYLYRSDYATFTAEVRAALDALANDSGPYVRSIDSTRLMESGLAAYAAQEFIDSLRADGVI
jgi:hypothetical protein